MKQMISNTIGFIILAIFVYFSFKRVINNAKQGGCGGCGGCNDEASKDEKGKGGKNQ